MLAFYEDRAGLARAYSRAATLSIHAPVQVGLSIPAHGHPRHDVPYQGRADIVSGLLALPDDQPLYDEDGEGMAEVDWELVLSADSGDVLLICYATHDRGASLVRRGAGKGIARSEIWVYEQRFVLRRREWDEEDR